MELCPSTRGACVDSGWLAQGAAVSTGRPSAVRARSDDFLSHMRQETARVWRTAGTGACESADPCARVSAPAQLSRRQSGHLSVFVAGMFAIRGECVLIVPQGMVGSVR